MSEVLAKRETHINQRAEQNLPPLPLNANEVEAIISELKISDTTHNRFKLLSELEEQVSPGKDPVADAKAAFLGEIANGAITIQEISKIRAVELLGKMYAGDAIDQLIDLLGNQEVGEQATETVSGMMLVYDNHLQKVIKLARTNSNAKTVLENWANATWFTKLPEVPNLIHVVAHVIEKAPTTDGFSPAPAAPTRTDIPLHAKQMFVQPNGSNPELIKLEALKASYPGVQIAVATVNGTVGLGSSRLSATNSLAWNTGRSIEGVPGKRNGAIVLYKDDIAPIFARAVKTDGGLPIKLDVSQLETGDYLTICPHKGEVYRNRPYNGEGKENDGKGKLIATYPVEQAWLQVMRVGSGTTFGIAKDNTAKAREALGLPPIDIFYEQEITPPTRGATLAEKILSKAAGREVRAGDVCEVKVDLVGSQDTTGGMTAAGIKAMGASKVAPNVTMLQSQCHTAGIITPQVLEQNGKLINFMYRFGAVCLKHGDGVIHSWLNKLIPSPWAIGVGGDSHTRFPFGISFGADSAVVANAAVTGKMLLGDGVPETVKVIIKGNFQPGITLRDAVNAIAAEGRKQNAGKNPFQDKIIEMYGLDNVPADIAFAFADASAERNATATVMAYNRATTLANVESNCDYVKKMISDGYDNDGLLSHKANEMQKFLDNPEFPEADKDAKYSMVIEVDLDKITEPLLSDPIPNPDDADNIRPLSYFSKKRIAEVFLGSCMTTAEDFVIAAEILRGFRESGGEVLRTKLWVAPPMANIEHALRKTGHWAEFEYFLMKEDGVAFEDRNGVSLEEAGCSFCMGNQKKMEPHAQAISTSTRPYVNRMGPAAQVHLASAPIAVITAIIGRVPTLAQYEKFTANLNLEFGRPVTQIQEVMKHAEITAPRELTALRG